jgi:HAD superfamily phosphatase (TIGR01668 family)
MSRLSPDRYYTSIQAIDLDDLERRGVRALLLDLDNTLVPRDTREITQGLRDWIADARERGFSLCIVSNNWHERVKAEADELGIPLVARALKPLPYAFRDGMRVLGVTPAQTAVIGDQIFTDVLGGNTIGATTILVDPLSRTDLPHTLLLRLIEARIMADREPLA